MLRYNHRLVERKWRQIWEQDASSCRELNRACTVLIPKNDEKLDLENARLLVLSDFFVSSRLGQKPQISAFRGRESWLGSAIELGLFAHHSNIAQTRHDFGVMCRDYASENDRMMASDVLCCGRLLHAPNLNDLLGDFGGDALRLYFLFQGPPERDYTFEWHGLVSARRFIERIWQLGLTCTGEMQVNPVGLQRVVDLTDAVKARVLQKKPHTALAAIMGHLKNKSMLSKTEVGDLATLLQPFTPFLSAELRDFVTPI